MLDDSGRDLRATEHTRDSPMELAQVRRGASEIPTSYDGRPRELWLQHSVGESSTVPLAARPVQCRLRKAKDQGAAQPRMTNGDQLGEG